jgi:hypothetical protein
MSRVYVPSSGPRSWQALLADPVKHWARGYSARTLANAWEDQAGFPPEIVAILQQQAALTDAEPLLIFPEWKVPLPGGSRPSQNDVWVLARSSAGTISIAVEGKVDEPFDKTIGEWKLDLSPAKKERLQFLLEVLDLSPRMPDSIRYQLLHRTASAVIEAERFNASHAVMLVHSFSPNNQWIEDFLAFTALFGLSAQVGRLASTQARHNLPLHFGWVHGNERFLCS